MVLMSNTDIDYNKPFFKIIKVISTYDPFEVAVIFKYFFLCMVYLKS